MLVLSGRRQRRSFGPGQDRKSPLPPDSPASNPPAAADLRQRNWHFPPLPTGPELALPPPFRSGGNRRKRPVRPPPGPSCPPSGPSWPVVRVRKAAGVGIPPDVSSIPRPSGRRSAASAPPPTATTLMIVAKVTMRVSQKIRLVNFFTGSGLLQRLPLPPRSIERRVPPASRRQRASLEDGYGRLSGLQTIPTWPTCGPGRTRAPFRWDVRRAGAREKESGKVSLTL